MMEEAQFQRLARRASTLKSEYGSGYGSGLRRHFYGDDYGDQEEHEARVVKVDEYGRGYRDGLAGKDPAPLTGRPPVLTDDERTKPRTIRLNDARWEKLQALGRGRLEAWLDSLP